MSAKPEVELFFSISPLSISKEVAIRCWTHN